MNEARQIVCGHCGRINRLPAARAPENARCGACHQPIFAGRPIEVDEEGFARHVANSDVPVLVDVWALGVAPVVRWRRCSSARLNSSSRRCAC
jgi:thioredoxin 2